MGTKITDIGLGKFRPIDVVTGNAHTNNTTFIIKPDKAGHNTTDLGFYRNGVLVRPPALTLDQWINISVSLVSSDWTKKLAELQYVPLHKITKSTPEATILKMRGDVEDHRGRRLAIPSDERSFLDQGVTLDYSDWKFQRENNSYWTLVNTGIDKACPVPYMLLLDISARILRDPLVDDVAKPLYVPWLTVRPLNVWIGNMFDTSRADEFERQPLEEKYMHQKSNGTPALNTHNTNLPKRTEVIADETVLLAALNKLLEVQNLSESAGSTAQVLAQSLRPLAESLAKELENKGVQPAPLGNVIDPTLIEAKVRELGAKVKAQILEECRETLQQLEPARVELARIESDKASLQALAADLAVRQKNIIDAEKNIDEEKATLRKEAEEFLDGQASELDKREKTLDARELLLSERESKLLEQEEQLRQKRLEDANDILRKYGDKK